MKKILHKVSKTICNTYNVKLFAFQANLKKKWWYDPSECKEIKVEKTRNELSLSNVAGIFFILVTI